MVFLPEAFDYMSENKEMCLSLAHSVDGPIIKDLSQMANDLDIWLSLGGFHEKVCNIKKKLGLAVGAGLGAGVWLVSILANPLVMCKLPVNLMTHQWV
jgi:hypothetical protein